MLWRYPCFSPTLERAAPMPLRQKVKSLQSRELDCNYAKIAECLLVPVVLFRGACFVRRSDFDPRLKRGLKQRACEAGIYPRLASSPLAGRE